MKEKVGILTINDDSNCGNRLQNYAVQEILKNCNVKPVTIVNLVNSNDNNYLKARLKRLIRVTFLWPLPKYQKAISFDKFNLKIKRALKVIKNEKDAEKIQKKYKTFFVGSDQVWNPCFNRTSPIDFLTFATENKRNSFSASFGISKIPTEKEEGYRQMLLEMNNISVRESEGKEIVERLTGRRDIELLLDPTMTLKIEEWNKIAKEPKKLSRQKYIFTYFLGNLSKERKQKIQSYAKSKGYQIINILDKNSPFYGSGPSEFIYLEKNAELICTDSFHSTVFAILYKRPFLIFNREDELENMNSRISTLLKKFGLEKFVYSGVIEGEKKDMQSDYDRIDEILEEEREHTYNFVKKVIWEEN